MSTFYFVLGFACYSIGMFGPYFGADMVTSTHALVLAALNIAIACWFKIGDKHNA